MNIKIKHYLKMIEKTIDLASTDMSKEEFSSFCDEATTLIEATQEARGIDEEASDENK